MFIIIIILMSLELQSYLCIFNIILYVTLFISIVLFISAITINYLTNYHYICQSLIYFRYSDLYFNTINVFKC